MAILTYHHIGECPADQLDHKGLWVTQWAFWQQLGWLRKNGYSAISLDEVKSALIDGKTLPRKWVVITFDDGWRDNYTKAFPLLAEFDFSATFFMVTGKVRADEAASNVGWDEYLSRAEIREMISGGMQFGSHTQTHPKLARLAKPEATHELSESKRALEEITGSDIRWLCYPYGNFSREAAEIARECGYAGALSTIRDNRPRPDQLFWLPRVMVMGDTTPARLRYILSPAYHWVHAWKNRRRWDGLASTRA